MYSRRRGRRNRHVCTYAALLLCFVVLRCRQSILTLGYTELASLMPALLNEYTRPDLFTLYGPSQVTFTKGLVLHLTCHRLVCL